MGQDTRFAAENFGMRRDTFRAGPRLALADLRVIMGGRQASGKEGECMAPSSSLTRVTRLRVPVPLPLRWVNVYRIGPAEGPWLLVDTGMDTPDARAAFEAALADWPTDRIVGLFLTHYHPDHTGLSGWLQDRLRVPVYMLAAERDLLYRTFAPDADTADQVSRYFEQHGMPSALTALIAADHQASMAVIRLASHIQGVADGHRWDLGDETWRVVLAPGHTPAQGLLLHGPSGTLLSGDHVLPRITPNISRWPGQPPDPLGQYLESLRHLQTLPLKVAWPAHGDVLTDPLGRVAEILRHHDLRLGTMEQALDAGPLTAYEVARAVFRPDLSPHQWRFAVGETLAHLEYLERRGRLAVTPTPPYKFRRVPTPDGGR